MMMHIVGHTGILPMQPEGGRAAVFEFARSCSIGVWQLGSERYRHRSNRLAVNITVDRTNASVPGMYAVSGF
jgi:hypothetical protein